MTESLKTPCLILVGVAAMAFQQFASFFQPHELSALTDAYDAAWQLIQATSEAMTPEEAVVIQNKIAQIILASACTGERDTERLKEIALRGVLGPRLVEASQIQQPIDHQAKQQEGEPNSRPGATPEGNAILLLQRTRGRGEGSKGQESVR